MRCSACEKDFIRTVQATLYEDKEKSQFVNSCTSIINMKIMCMECFLRINGITEYININDLPDVWFKKVENE